MDSSAGMGPLPDGGRVVIIGGGPGGTACALRLQLRAKQLDKRVQITLVEGKQFSGEHHYNQCSGVLAPPLPALLEDELHIPFPSHLCRATIRGYVLHSANEQIRLTGEGDASLSLRRVQFDAYMMETILQQGINVVPARAVDMEFHHDRVMIYTENAPHECDIVVGAFGLDEGSAALFTRTTRYRPPDYLSSVVTKYHPSPHGIAGFGDYIHAFLPSHPRIEFGAVTPKGNHLTINIAGRSVDVDLMNSFLSIPAVRKVLPNLEEAGKYDPNDLRFFKGRFPCSLAGGYYGDRYVTVGDAAGLVRAFKGKGVTSAVQTGIRAADTIMLAGISESAFRDHFHSANQDIIRDLPFGRLMRLLTIILARFSLLTPVVRAAQNNAALRAALFDAISAHGPYQQVLANAFRPRSLAAVLGAMVSASSG